MGIGLKSSKNVGGGLLVIESERGHGILAEGAGEKRQLVLAGLAEGGALIESKSDKGHGEGEDSGSQDEQGQLAAE